MNISPTPADMSLSVLFFLAFSFLRLFHNFLARHFNISREFLSVMVHDYALFFLSKFQLCWN
jgi:hypothetical protein